MTTRPSTQPRGAPRFMSSALRGFSQWAMPEAPAGGVRWP
jgi:hypothetical protein